MDPFTVFLILLVPTALILGMTKGHIAERVMSYRTMRKKKKEMHAKVQDEFANMLRMMVSTNQITVGDRVSVEKKLTKAGYDVSDEPTYGKPAYVKKPWPNAETLKRQIRERLGPKVLYLKDALKLRRGKSANIKSKSPFEGVKVYKKKA